MPIHAQYFDGETAQAHDIQLTLDEQGLLHCEPLFFNAVKLDEIKISPRIGNIARRLSLASGAMIEITDHDTLDKWLNQHQIKQSFIHKIENSMKYVIASVSFIALFVAWIAIYGIPMFSTVTANALPQQVSSFIGDGALESMDDRFFTPSELPEQRKQALTQHFIQLLPNSTESDPINYSLEFRKSDLVGPNAFALPNGTVVITDELIKLAEHDEEIYSILLHEIGHVEYRHSLRQVISHSGLAILTVLITGDINSAGSMIIALPNILMSTSYSRDIEWEADGYALEQMQKLGMSPTHFANFMEKIDNYVPDELEAELKPHSGMTEEPTVTTTNNEDQSSSEQCETSTTKQKFNIDLGWLNYISTHPATEDRIARFRNAGQ